MHSLSIHKSHSIFRDIKYFAIRHSVRKFLVHGRDIPRLNQEIPAVKSIQIAGSRILASNWKPDGCHVELCQGLQKREIKPTGVHEVVHFPSN